MKNSFLVAIAVIIATGCASTNVNQNSKQMDKLFTQFNSQAENIAPSDDDSYSNQHAELAKVVGAQQKSVDSPYGKFYVFSKGGFQSYVPRRSQFFTTAEELFKNSCKGKTEILDRFESAAHKGWFNPENYATEEEIQLMLADYRVGSKFYLRLLHSTISRYYRENLDYYEGPFFYGIDFGGQGLNIPTDALSRVHKGTKACYKDGKIVGAQIIFGTYKEETINTEQAGTHIVPVSGSHTLTVLYLPADTLDRYAQEVYNNRKADIERGILNEKEEAERQLSIERAKERAREQARLKQVREYQIVFERKQKKIKLHNAANELLWAERYNNEFTAGDPVCTTDNKMGFIEQANDKNIKVWFKGVVLYKNRNFFFGNSNDDPDESFEYRKIDELTWVKRGEVALCNFKLNLG